MATLEETDFIQEKEITETEEKIATPTFQFVSIFLN
jgi:hypothetical protein